MSRHGDEKETIRIISARQASRKERAAYSRLQIDFSDMPELSDEQLKNMKRLGRPATGIAKQVNAIRLSPRFMAARQSKPDQRLIHELLEKAVSRAA